MYPPSKSLKKMANLSYIRQTCAYDTCMARKRTKQQEARWYETHLEKEEAIKREFMDQLGGICQSCGYNKCIRSLVFHHIDPSKKKFQLGKIRRKIRDFGMPAVIKEVAKCQLLCHNCHSELHYNEQREKNRILIEGVN